MDKFLRNFIVVVISFLFVFSLSFFCFERIKIKSVSAEDTTISVEFKGDKTYYADFSSALNYALTLSSDENNVAVINVPSTVFASNLTITAGKFIKIAGASPEVTIKRSGTANLFIVNGNLCLENITLDGGAVYTYNGEIVDYPYPNSSIAGSATKSLIQVNAGGKLILNTGSTVQNCAAGKGAAIMLNGDLQLTGGKIRANRGTSGVAVYMQNGSVFTMSSGTIENNYASARGSAVYNSASTLNLFGGSVINNISSTEGAIHLLANSIANLSGNPVVTGNNDESENACNIYTLTALNIIETLSDETKISIATLANDTAFLNGALESHLAYFFSDETNKEIYISEGSLKIREKTLKATVFYIINTVDTIKKDLIYDKTTTLTAPSIEKTGYLLDGWYSEGAKWDFDEIVTFEGDVPEEIELTAKWILKTPNLSKILFESVESEEGKLNAEKEVKSISVLPSHDIKEEILYEYEWLKDDVVISSFSTIRLQKKTDEGVYKVRVRAVYGTDESEYALSAIITIKTYYTVDFYVDGNLCETQEIDETFATSPSCINKTGFDFLGWSSKCDEFCAWNFETSKIDSNIILFAGWKLLSPTCEGLASDKTDNRTIEGEELTLTATFNHPLTGDWCYEWYKNGEMIDNATTKTFTVSSIEGSGDYYCKAFFTYEEKIESAVTTKLSVTVLKRKLTVEVFDEEQNKILSSTLETDRGIDPGASLIIEEKNKDGFEVGENLTEGQEIIKAFSVLLKKEDEEVIMPDLATLTFSFELSSEEEIAKILLIKLDGTQEEINMQKIEGKLIFEIKSLGNIIFISTAEPTVSTPNNGSEDSDIESEDRGALKESNTFVGNESSKRFFFDFMDFIFIFLNCFLLLVFVAVLTKKRKRNKLKI